MIRGKKVRLVYTCKFLSILFFCRTTYPGGPWLWCIDIYILLPATTIPLGTNYCLQGVTLLFRLDPACVAQHAGERRVKARSEELVSSGSDANAASSHHSYLIQSEQDLDDNVSLHSEATAQQDEAVSESSEIEDTDFTTNLVRTASQQTPSTSASSAVVLSSDNFPSFGGIFS